MVDMLVIEDSTIASMVQKPEFVNAIPCLVNQKSVVVPSHTGCGSCARRKSEAQRSAIANIKTCLIGLSSEKKAELKTLLNTKQVKIAFSTASGQVTFATF
jgi:hypothetical protein